MGARHQVLPTGARPGVLYAMDYPYQASKEEVAVHDNLDIPLEHKRMLMQTNAERVFRLPPLRG